MTESSELVEQVEQADQFAQRKAKLAELRKMGNPYPNSFRRNALAAQLHSDYGMVEHHAFEELAKHVKVAGRIMLRRLMGKASFIHLQDMSGRIQAYLRQEDLPEGIYEAFKHWDLGDIVGVEGILFKTKTGELSIKAERVELLTKALRPLPDKFHGLTDHELRYRYRYVDLFMNEDSRRIFQIRARLVDGIRHFLNQHGFLEVETPMMHAIAGGALARPFTTHHNTLDMDLYLRVAPELFLKRLVVGGIEKVYEINRNFRNEGLSTRHNPEFTMLEFYQAYTDYHDLMDLTEELMRYLAKEVLGTSVLNYQGESYNLANPFNRMSVKEAILHYNPTLAAENYNDLETIRAVAKKLGIVIQPHYGIGKIQFEIFEKTVEPKLKNPTFITEYPTEVSPLARRNEQDPTIVDRFEFYVGGRELANGFSELNDPEDQADRFMRQVQAKTKGDQEAMPFDEDYITALEYGLPPTAGEGIGIDRLAMLFTDMPSIRDVLLFPLLRPIE